jgi:hypothetical protein
MVNQVALTFLKTLFTHVTSIDEHVELELSAVPR